MNERHNVRDEEQLGRPTVMNEDLTEKVDEEIHQNRYFTFDELGINSGGYWE
ncbi:hypothetical protein J6590_030769 [Homalodisca vitripennis]|nr:hypothetical protein J6590_030769 [Homalodisca vitripennis]